MRAARLVALLGIVAGGGIGMLAGHGHGDAAPTSPRVCFPADHWGPAPERVRPCVRVVHVEEDGSFSFAVSDADGTVRYTSGVGALDR